MKMSVVTLSEALKSAEIFVDGDWVESKDQDPNGEVRLVQLADIGDGKYLDKSFRFMTMKKASELKCTFLKTGDVLVARMPDPLGRACLFPGDSKPSVTVVDICIIRPIKEHQDARWLMYCLNTPFCRKQIAGYLTGTTRSRISRNNLGKIKIPLIPLPEQRRIAEILDKAEGLRAKRRTALALLDTLTQSIFIDMFGDPNEIQVRWENVKLGNILDFLTSGSRGWANYYSDSGDLFLRIQNVKHDELILNDVAFVHAPDTAEAKRTRVEPGDVLLSITADLGRTAVIPDNIGNAFINQHLSILRTKVTSPRYLSAYLSSPAGQKQVHRSDKHAVKAGLNFDDIRSFVIPLPPLFLQQDFTRRIDAVEKLKDVHRASLVKLDELFAALQHRAFRGEL